MRARIHSIKNFKNSYNDDNIIHKETEKDTRTGLENLLLPSLLHIQIHRPEIIKTIHLNIVLVYTRI